MPESLIDDLPLRKQALTIINYDLFCQMYTRKLKQTLLLLISIGVLIATPVDAFHVHHDMRIVLDPDSNRLRGVDTLTIRPAPANESILHINRHATAVRIEANDQPVPFEFKNTALRVRASNGPPKEALELTVFYSVRFDDPVPVMPVNADNPGYGVSGTISPVGTLLLDGAGWYPHIDADRTTYRLQVEAPAGTIAVTAGKSLGHQSDGDKTVSTWEINYPVRGLSLSAARYLVKERTIGRLTVATYLFPESADLSDPYLEATARYIRLYEDLFGPYPFEKFAVVENFFPTGFGFPSYTLLGSRVLRLPFIIDTSLGHEIAHCWWGNGVYVDVNGGNWSEGLTTYVAEYLYKERKSPEAAREYRQQILRNYATLVNPGNDFPISQFQSRSSPVTKTIGYDKCAMVFHMLRRRLGEKIFWGSLRDIYRDNLFQRVSWRQLRQSFERRAGIDLKEFFDQWIARDGAPRLVLADVAAGRKNGEWRVKGELVQGPPYFETEAEVALVSAEEVVRRMVSLASTEATTAFEIESLQPPASLVVDPDVNFFRKLDPSEIPSSVNTLKGADSVLVVLADGMEKVFRPLADIIVMSLGLDNYHVVPENQVTPDALGANNLLLVGYGATAAKLLDAVAHERHIAISGEKFVLSNGTYDNPSDAFFGVFDHPLSRGRVAALFLPLSSRYAEVVARKITHYGKYSYLSFSGGRNRAKGVWTIEKSPLIHQFGSDD